MEVKIYLTKIDVKIDVLKMVKSKYQNMLYLGLRKIKKNVGQAFHMA